MLVGLAHRAALVVEMTKWHGMVCSDGDCMSNRYDTLCMSSSW
jgi:hypothetical protein